MRVQLRSTILAILLGTHSLTVTPQSIKASLYTSMQVLLESGAGRAEQGEGDRKRVRERGERKREREKERFLHSLAPKHAYMHMEDARACLEWPAPHREEVSPVGPGGFGFVWCHVEHLRWQPRGLLAGRV